MKIYQEPKTLVLEMNAEQMIASSADAGGSGSDMPWGANKRESLDWDDYMK